MGLKMQFKRVVCWNNLEVNKAVHWMALVFFQSLVFNLHLERGRQLFDHHFLRLLLHQSGRLETSLRHRSNWSSHFLRTWMATLRIHGSCPNIKYVWSVGNLIQKTIVRSVVMNVVSNCCWKSQRYSHLLFFSFHGIFFTIINPSYHFEVTYNSKSEISIDVWFDF